MAEIFNKRSGMVVFSGDDHYSHQVRIALAEKACLVDLVAVDANNPPEDLLDLNPYNTLPTLVERDLVLYESALVLEYLDERFPHPPLLPVYPVLRAKTRLLIHRMRQDWYSLCDQIITGTDKQADKARQHLLEQLVELAPVFLKSPYFMSEEFSMLDCYILPLLWRLPSLEIELPDSAKAIHRYANKQFRRPSFLRSLTDAEKQLRDLAPA